MPGKQLAPFWQGNRAELFATFALSSVAAVVVVPRQVDFGLDLFCTLTHQGGNALYAGRSFGVQVKSASNPEGRYGGFDNAGAWKSYEIEWLYGQDLPMLLCTVDRDLWQVKLYSVTRMWWVPYKMGTPGEVVLVPDLELEQLNGPDPEIRYPRKVMQPSADGSRAGDGYSYRIPLGKPVVQFALDQDEAPEQCDIIRKCIDTWVYLESRNLRHYKMHVPYTEEWKEWSPNVPPESGIQLWHYFNPTPDKNVREILAAISPGVASLFHQLRVQKQDQKLEQVIPICHLLGEYECLDKSVADEVIKRDQAGGADIVV
jgi:hypothetical protein